MQPIYYEHFMTNPYARNPIHGFSHYTFLSSLLYIRIMIRYICSLKCILPRYTTDLCFMKRKGKKMANENSESQRRTKNLKYLRISNRAEIIRSLAITGPISRIKLSRQLGLSKMAISAIVSEMIEEGLIMEQGTALPESRSPKSIPANSTGGAGRRPSMLAINKERINALGLYLSRDAIEGVLCDVSGKIIKTWISPLDEHTDTDKYLAQLAEIIDSMLDQTKGFRIFGLGISCIGPVDIATGRLLSPANFHGIHDVDLTAFISGKCSLPIILDNDMNAAVQAEQLYGAAKNYRHVVYLGITNGIGAGIISYGRIFQGSSGFGGEIGHMSVNLDGPDCSCGNRGCLELYASIPVLLHQSGARTLQDMVDQAIKDPSSADRWQPRLMQALTTSLINTANIFDPEIILLGHQSIYLAPLLLPELENAINKHSIQRAIRNIPVRVAAFGEQSPLVGAAALIFQAVFRGELTLV